MLRVNPRAQCVEIGHTPVGSVVFFDLGITDAITDKHRDYPRQVLVACNR